MTYSGNVDWPAMTGRLREQMDALPRNGKKALAEKLGISPAQLSQFISGHRGLTPERAQQVADALGIEVNVQMKFADGKVEE